MFFSQESLKKLESAVDHAMHSEFKKDEIMHKFHNEDWFDENYYKRHILECVIRIHMNNEWLCCTNLSVKAFSAI